jgi:carbon storage regulator CsrA
MFVNALRIGQPLRINTSEGQIDVVVTSVRGQVIRVGVEAPKSVKIHRDELPRRSPPRAA